MRATDRVAAALPVSSGAAVMATGIVSIALLYDGHRTASDVLMWITVAVWVALAALVAVPAWRLRLIGALADPAVLTAVAGTCVLGSRLADAGWRGVAGALLIAAVLLWLLMVPRVLRALDPRVQGSAFLITVATEAVAVTALSLHSRWLDWAAIVPIAAGLAAYVAVIARFDLRELVRGRGDQWVAGGAIAIASLACAQLAATHVVGFAGPLALVLWLAAAAWIPVLVAGELAGGPRPFDARRWATVFPLGMYAAAGTKAGTVQGATWLVDVAHVLVWVALAAWLATSVAALTRARVLRG